MLETTLCNIMFCEIPLTTLKRNYYIDVGGGDGVLHVLLHVVKVTELVVDLTRVSLGQPTLSRVLPAGILPQDLKNHPPDLLDPQA